jgi:hypothetical protein
MNGATHMVNFPQMLPKRWHLSVGRLMVNELLNSRRYAGADPDRGRDCSRCAMRAVLGFLSSLALGLMIAAILVVGATNVMNTPARLPMSGTLLDYVSVVIGLGLGLVIAVIGRISWAELPRRAAQWVVHHAYRLRLFAWAALFVGILVYF